MVFFTYEAVFLTDETGFFTYHGFVTITTLSRIISRDTSTIPVRCYGLMLLEKQLDFRFFSLFLKIE
jgi:hypothetical protein